MRNFDPDDIRQSVSVQDVAERYCGLHPARNGRVPCPFHNGKDNNFAFFGNDLYKGDGNDHYYCFVCGATGDVIKFVQGVFNYDWKTACKTINDDFGLGLPIDRELTEAEKKEAARKRKKKQELYALMEQARTWKEINREKYELLYVTCDIILARMNPNKLGKVSPLWVWATHNIAAAEYEYQKYR